MIYVSFVTRNSPYMKVVEEYLIPSLKKWNLKYDIDYIDNRGSWAENVYYKPEFINKMLNKHQQPIVSLDADASIEQYPSLFASLPLNIDVAAHYLDWKTWYGKGDRKELLGGTLYFNYNANVLNMVSKWMDIQKEAPRMAQRVLEDTLRQNKGIKVYELPLSYCYIKSRPGDKPPLVLLNPVILHHQVSRLYK